jgi:hypothetical protein
VSAGNHEQQPEAKRWAVQGVCPKCRGRAYKGGYCLDCGAYCSGDKPQMEKRYGVIERLFDTPRGGEL